MTVWLKQSTAVTLVMGPFVDSGDGATAEIALDITEQEVLLSKNGGAFTLKSDTTHGVHDAAHNGWYTIPLNTTDTNTLGALSIAINMTGALPCWKECMVLAADAWDSLFGAVVLGQAGAQAALVANNLDHLCKTATAGVDMTTEVADGTIISRMLSNSDTSLFVPATHSLQIVGADVGLVHGHVNTIDGHITADYTATEKTAIDLLDDAAGGLADIHTDVADIHTDVVAVKGDTAAILLDTGTDGVLVSATGLTAINAEVVDVVATDVIADSIAAHEVRPTMRQALLMIYRYLLERSVSTTTVTVKKEDGSTSAYTLTLDDADAPTSITRAT